MIDKEIFTELWNEHIEPLFESGELVWECSPILAEHLMKCGDWTYTDDEVWELIQAGKL
jgi:hypothetical protein